jgi:hypothetical protein
VDEQLARNRIAAQQAADLKKAADAIGNAQGCP